MPLLSGRRVLLLGAHPDDETIGAGRLVAAHDGPVTAVTFSAGENCVEGLDPEAMAADRLAEWRAALVHLGAEPWETSRWPDGGLADVEVELTDAIDVLLAGVDVVVSVWAHDPHPDHAAVGRAARTACAAAGTPLVEYPVWAPLWLTADEVAQVGGRLSPLPSSEEADRAWTAAIAEYSSQTRPLRPGLAAVVPRELLQQHAHQLVVTTDA